MTVIARVSRHLARALQSAAYLFLVICLMLLFCSLAVFAFWSLTASATTYPQAGLKLPLIRTQIHRPASFHDGVLTSEVQIVNSKE